MTFPRTLATAAVLIVSLVVVAALAAGCCPTQNFEKVPSADVDEDQKEAAAEFGQRVLSGWKKGEYEDLGDEITSELAASFSPDDQKEHHKKIKNLAGEFESMKFVEAQKSVPDEHLVYRFRGTFDGKDGWEVRVVYDLKGKVAGFWVKPWQDAFN